VAATQDLAGLIQLILRVMAAPESFSELPLTTGDQERTEAEYALLLRRYLREADGWSRRIVLKNSLASPTRL
jgi:hypothetical protein